jgi:hypothetical protein
MVLVGIRVCHIQSFPTIKKKIPSGPPPPIEKNFSRFFSHFFISRFAERRALGKGFAESLRGFAESLGPSAKQPAPVVNTFTVDIKVVKLRATIS